MLCKKILKTQLFDNQLFVGIKCPVFITLVFYNMFLWRFTRPLTQMPRMALDFQDYRIFRKSKTECLTGIKLYYIVV